MQTPTWPELFLGIAVFLGFLGMLIFVVLQQKDKNNLITALTETVKSFSDNTQALDLLESLATKVVPASLVAQANKGADLLESFTPDEIDLLIEQFRAILNKATDGSPNTTTVTLPPNSTTTIVAGSTSDTIVLVPTPDNAAPVESTAAG